MGNMLEVKVPEIGDFKDVPIIEVQVKPGMAVKPEDSLVTLESDKATFDVPAPSAGIVKEVKVGVGDKVSEGSLILLLETGAGAKTEDAPAAPAAAVNPPTAPAQTAPAKPAASASRTIEVTVPEIGDFKNVPIIEIQVQPGSVVKPEDSLVTLESEKATFDVPAPAGGTVKELKVKIGDKVSEGSAILVLETGDGTVLKTEEQKPASIAASVPPPQPKSTEPAAAAPPPPAAAWTPTTSVATAPPTAPAPPKADEYVPSPVSVHLPSPGETAAQLLGGHMAHASPVVRQFARELGVDLAKVNGTGPSGRITREDVQKYVKSVLAAPPAAPASSGVGLDLLPWPQVDFAKFGPVESKPLSRIKKLSGANLARNWVMIPHVTQFDEADITDLEAFRVQVNKENEKAGMKLTMLAFLIKASVAALKKFPDFNASLDGDKLVMKGYWNIGFAADTPNGLMVPVIREADRKSVAEIAAETAQLAAKAREGKLGMADMQGGCFTISSLGGIGGTAFTPIINAPEVAILGVSKSELKPKWNGKEFVPRLTLPLSLSYDHRVIDGAAAARFASFLAQLLADMRRSLL